MPTVSIDIQKDAMIPATKLAKAAHLEQLNLKQVLMRSLRRQIKTQHTKINTPKSA